MPRTFVDDRHVFRGVAVLSFEADPDHWNENRHKPWQERIEVGPYTSTSSASSVLTSQINQRLWGRRFGTPDPAIERWIEQATTTWERVA
ncbi:hypothetical protein [Micromonospora sp. NPDC048839]|uniref:hypothetical protein n=1 Tax=Micromonospora sp. NPDC048839 TaxID=3155641 RepID=UPI0033FCB04C